jgi:MFS family permease
MEEHLALKKRLRPLFVGAFLQAFVFWYAIEKPFLNSLGLNNAAMALVSIIFSASYLILNVPFGVIADRWSRRDMLLLGSVFLVFDCVIAGTSHNLLAYAIASILFGAYVASTQGTYDSIIYDTVLEETQTNEYYTHYYGRLRFVEGVGLALSSLLGGIVAHYINLRAPYLLTIPVAALSVPALLMFQEPRLHKRGVTQNLHHQLGQTVRVILKKGTTAQVVGSLVLITIGILIMSQLDQLWVLALSLPILLYGPVNALLLAGTAVSGFLASRANKARIGPLIVVGSVIVASLLLLVHKLPVIVLAQVLFLGGVTILQIILNRQLHSVADSHVRSGASSLVTTIGTLLFLPIALLFGFISDRYTVFRAAWIVVILIFILCLMSLRVLYVQPTTE